MSQTRNDAGLAPFEIWEVMLDNSTIKFHKPLVVTPRRMPHDQDEPGDVEYWEVDFPQLNISAHGRTRQELWECVLGDIRFNWIEYVSMDDRKLAPLAKSYKDAYLAMAEVVDG